MPVLESVKFAMLMGEYAEAVPTGNVKEAELGAVVNGTVNRPLI